MNDEIVKNFDDPRGQTSFFPTSSIKFSFQDNFWYPDKAKEEAQKAKMEHWTPPEHRSWQVSLAT